MNRKRVQRLMRQMGLSALYPKPRTSQPGAGHKVYPYLLKSLSIERPNQAVGERYLLRPNGAGVHVSGGHPGLVLAPGPGLACGPRNTFDSGLSEIPIVFRGPVPSAFIQVRTTSGDLQYADQVNYHVRQPVVRTESAGQPCPERGGCLVSAWTIHILVFDAAPETLDERVRRPSVPCRMLMANTHGLCSTVVNAWDVN